jgi:hypothetical protein
LSLESTNEMPTTKTSTKLLAGAVLLNFKVGFVMTQA